MQKFLQITYHIYYDFGFDVVLKCVSRSEFVNEILYRRAPFLNTSFYAHKKRLK